jgi:hypothetical protein
MNLDILIYHKGTGSQPGWAQLPTGSLVDVPIRERYHALISGEFFVPKPVYSAKEGNALPSAGMTPRNIQTPAPQAVGLANTTETGVQCSTNFC